MSRPLRSGILMSRITRSQLPARSLSRVSLPEAASPISVMLRSSTRNCRRPARTMAWSSASNSFVIVFPIPMEPRACHACMSCVGFHSLLLSVNGQLVIQGLQAASQCLGCSILVARPMRQRRLDQPALSLRQGRSNRHTDAVGVLVRSASVAARDVEIHRLQLQLVFAQDICPLDRVLQFTHVAGPAIFAQGALGAAAEHLRRVVACIDLIQEMFGAQA